MVVVVVAVFAKTKKHSFYSNIFIFSLKTTDTDRTAWHEQMDG